MAAQKQRKKINKSRLSTVKHVYNNILQIMIIFDT